MGNLADLGAAALSQSWPLLRVLMGEAQIQSLAAAKENDAKWPEMARKIDVLAEIAGKMLDSGVMNRLSDLVSGVANLKYQQDDGTALYIVSMGPRHIDGESLTGIAWIEPQCSFQWVDVMSIASNAALDLDFVPTPLAKLSPELLDVAQTAVANRQRPR